MHNPVSRVLMSTDSVGNPWTLALELGRAFEERGIELVLVALGRKLSDEQRRSAWNVSTLTLHEQPLRAEWMADPWDDVHQAGEILLSLEQRYAPDIVQLGSYAHAALPFRAPVVLSAHACVLCFWQATHGVPAPMEFDTYREHAAAGLRAAQAVVSSTQCLLDQLAHYHGPFAGGRVIRAGCASELFSPDAKEDLVLSASRSWDGPRNLGLLSQAAERVAWPILVAADDTRPPGDVPRVDHDPMGIHRLGRLSRAALAEHLGRAAIYALPGSVDPTGLSVLEAALSGCTLVLGDTPYLRELWSDAALFCDSEDTEALVAAINGLAANAPRRQALAQAAYERAHSCSLSRSAEAHLSLYEELLSARTSKADRTQGRGRITHGRALGSQSRRAP